MSNVSKISTKNRKITSYMLLKTLDDIEYQIERLRNIAELISLQLAENEVNCVEHRSDRKH